jgi:succinate dehydrogenase / fumarate reductase flavoprotein subunit
MLEDIRKSCWKLAGILREESELLELQAHLAACRKEIEERGIQPVKDKTDTIINAMRVLTVIDLAELLCKGALERKECRGAHYRTDHTAMDPQYHKNFFHQKVDGKIVSTWETTPQPSERLQKALDAFDDDNRLKNYTHSE